MNSIQFLKHTIKNLLKEEVEENTTGFDNYQDFQNRDVSEDVYVYHRTPSKNIESIFTYGGLGCTEWNKTMCYGRGIYTMLGDNGHEHVRSYGDAVIKFRLKNGLRNFIFVNKQVQNDAFNLVNMPEKRPDESDSEYQERINKFTYLNGFTDISGNHRYQPFRERMQNNMSNKDFANYENAFGRTLPDELRNNPGHELNPTGRQVKLGNERNSDQTDDEFFDRSNCDGVVYHYAGGVAVLVKKMDALIPVAYMGPHTNGQFVDTLTTKDGKQKNLEDFFDNLNNSTDAMRFRDYDNFSDYRLLKPIMGVTLVMKGKDSKGNYKGNYLFGKTGRKMFFADVDNPKPPIVNGEGATAEFQIGERTMQLIIDKDYNVHVRSIVRTKKTKDRFGNDIEQPVFEDLEISQMNEKVAYNRTFQEMDRMIKSGEIPTAQKGVKPEQVQSYMDNGILPDELGRRGDSSLYYGLGGYAYRKDRGSGSFGSAHIDFGLRNGYEDFLIFDNDARAEFDPGQSVYDEILRLVPKSMLPELDKNLRNNPNPGCVPEIKKLGLEAFKHIPNGYNAGYAKAFYEAITSGETRGGENAGGLTGAHAAKEETKLSQTDIKGYIYYGKQDGYCVMPRDVKAMIPMHGQNDDGTNQMDIDQAKYDELNGRAYPKMFKNMGYKDNTFVDVAPNGISLMKNGDGINYVTPWHTTLLPFDISDSTATIYGDNGADFRIKIGNGKRQLPISVHMEVEGEHMIPHFRVTLPNGKSFPIVGKDNLETTLNKIKDLLTNDSNTQGKSV